MNPAYRRALAGSVLALTLLSGCDAGGVLSSDDPEGEVPPTEPSAAPESEDAMPVGDTFVAAASTTVIAVAKGGDPSWAPAGEGYDWLWANVRTCVPAGGSVTEVGWYQWAVSGTDGGWYPADLDYASGRPTNQYPRLADVAPGKCAEGRVLVAVPDRAEVVVLVNADDHGVPQGSWLLGEAGAPADTDGE